MRTLLPFEYLEPDTVDSALALLADAECSILAGGVDLVLKLRMRTVTAERVLSLHRIAGLDSISITDDGLSIGAMTPLWAVEQDARVRDGWPLLVEAVGSITSTQIKSMGTVAGNLCIAGFSSDVGAALLVLGGELTIASQGGERRIGIDEFYDESGETVLQSNELVTAIHVPATQASGAFLKLTGLAEDLPKVSVVAALTITDGQCTDARIATASVGSRRLRQAEATMIDQEPTPARFAAAGEAAAQDLSSVSDDAYLRHVINVLTRDALTAAAQPA